MSCESSLNTFRKKQNEKIVTSVSVKRTRHHQLSQTSQSEFHENKDVNFGTNYNIKKYMRRAMHHHDQRRQIDDCPDRLYRSLLLPRLFLVMSRFTIRFHYRILVSLRRNHVKGGTLIKARCSCQLKLPRSKKTENAVSVLWTVSVLSYRAFFHEHSLKETKKKATAAGLFFIIGTEKYFTVIRKRFTKTTRL